MPYSIEQTEACPAAKPFGVTKDSDGSLMGCHASQAAAQKQIAALYASEAVAAVRYDHIDFSPPAGVREEAARGLEWRREYNRGGTEVGVARARDLSNGKNISPETARRMKAYFDRHEVDKQGEGFSPGEDGFPSAGRIAWALWGGDAGQAWANKIDRQMDAADNADKPRAAVTTARNEIRLYGSVGYPGMTSQMFKTLLAEADPSQELIIRIDSEGGSVFDGFGIYDAIAAWEGRSRAIVESSAFSIASLIAMAADTVEITENGYLMIHNPWMQTEGDFAKLAKDAEQLAKLRDKMMAVYQDKTGKTAEEIQQVMQTETWLDASDAVAQGYVDRVLPTARKSAAAAKYQGNMPERVNQSLNVSGDSSGEMETQQGEISMSNQKILATTKSIKARWPLAKSDFIVAALEQEMTDEQVAEMYYSEMVKENEMLKAKLAAMEQEMAAVKTKAEEMKVVEVEEEDDEEEKMVMMPAAKARPGVQPVASSAAPAAVRKTARQQWNDILADYVAKGMSKPQAAKRMARDHRDLQQSMIEEAN
jgi:ATP-dependent protease ClpP protease subunit